jgi:hypothetical protein
MSKPNSGGPSLSSMYHLLRSGRLTDCRERTWSRKAQTRSGGTEGSNPAPSSGESGANFASRVTRRNVTLGNPTLTSELKERLAAGITAKTAGRGVAELAAWRDGFLVADREQGFVASVLNSTRLFHGAGTRGSVRKPRKGGGHKCPACLARRAAADDRSTLPRSDHRPGGDGGIRRLRWG